ncbi:MAG: hypothetical protein WB763_12010, partial [Terriglobia bacterium]
LSSPFLGNAKIGRVQENSRGTPGDARLLATAGSAYLPFPKLLVSARSIGGGKGRSGVCAYTGETANV